MIEQPILVRNHAGFAAGQRFDELHRDKPTAPRATCLQVIDGRGAGILVLNQYILQGLAQHGFHRRFITCSGLQDIGQQPDDTIQRFMLAMALIAGGLFGLHDRFDAIPVPVKVGRHFLQSDQLGACLIALEVQGLGFLYLGPQIGGPGGQVGFEPIDLMVQFRNLLFDLLELLLGRFLLGIGIRDLAPGQYHFFIDTDQPPLEGLFII